MLNLMNKKQLIFQLVDKQWVVQKSYLVHQKFWPF